MRPKQKAPTHSWILETISKEKFCARLLLIAIFSILSAINVNAASTRKFGFTLVPNLGIVHPGLGSGIDINIHNFGGFSHKLKTGASIELFGAEDSSNAHIEAGYLIGRMKRNGWGYVSASAGLSFLETTYRGRTIVEPNCFLISCTGGVYEISKSQTVGIPFQFEAVLMKNFVGIGVSILGNLNLDRSYGGMVVEIPIGWIGTPL